MAGQGVELCSECTKVKLDSKLCPLMLAIYTGHVECVELLLNTKSNISEARRKCKQNLLLWAAQICDRNGERIAKLMVDKGCNVNIAIDQAVHFQDTKAVEILLKAGAKVNKPGHHKFTLLHSVFLKQYKNDIVKQHRLAEILVDAGADVNKIDRLLNPPLHYAIEIWNVEGVKLLLRSGASVNLVNRFGDSALDLALKRLPTNDVLNLIIKAGADLSVQKCDRLAMAAASCNTEVLKLLLDKGVDVRMSSPNGCTVLFAASTSNRECMELLLLAGADVNKADRAGNSALKCFLTAADPLKKQNVGKLLFAAGEIIDFALVGQSANADARKLKQLETGHRLDEICRGTIRRHLLDVDRHENLFLRIPKLPLPSVVKDFLLFGILSKIGTI